MALSGLSLIGYGAGKPGGPTVQLRDRQKGHLLEPMFSEASKTELDRSVELATSAFPAFAAVQPDRRAIFLETVAEKLEDRREELVARSHQETGLTVTRLSGELTQTCSQLKFLAGIVRRSVHLDIRIDLADPHRTPTSKAEIRSMQRPLGPVAVFCGASAPFFLSVAGADTASALAAGCPVIVKSQPSQMGTCELAAQAIREACERCAMPEGTFSMLHLCQADAVELVEHPLIDGVAYTGARQGGLKLYHTAMARSRPIPVYATLSSLNPVVAFPKFLSLGARRFAADFAEHVCANAGQCYTHTSLLLAIGDTGPLLQAMRDSLEHAAVGLMVDDKSADAYGEETKRRMEMEGVETLLRPSGAGAASLFATDLPTFVSRPELRSVFAGPCALVVRCRDIQEALSGLKALDGQLTASLHLDESEIESASFLFAQMERIAGRLLVNAFPDAVEVGESIVYGGPFPATVDARSTAVGGRAISRWMRPVCYEDVPMELLPPELRPPPYS